MPNENGMTGFAGSWGALLVGTDRARFRLWAPGEDQVSLRLDGRDMPMQRSADGWFELDVEARAGMEYAFVLEDGFAVPDPASRAQANDVHGSSLLVDPLAYRWQNPGWAGRPWHEAVIYELHVGTFTAEGTFRAAIEKLPHLAETGVTAIEIMPVAQFGGTRGWGYDGVLPYCPHRTYGGADDFKALIDAAHGVGLMVLLDVVYNHFGPDGNYLGRYAPHFFHPERHTPWGAAIAYEKPEVRSFFIDNALYWLSEYRLDGLRLDAIDQIHDEESDPDILVEIARNLRARISDRPVHLTTEDSRNITRLHERDGQAVPLYTGEWNDDFHNAMHVLATGEGDGYYVDYVSHPTAKLARSLAEGFAFQGQVSEYTGSVGRGKPSAHLPPTVFVDFIQNHDQIGNRAFGDRLITGIAPDLAQALTTILLLSPHIPLVFMGEEFAETAPFRFFTDFHGDLADAVRNGRRREFRDFKAFAKEGQHLSAIPDPNALETFESSKLDWANAADDETRGWRETFRALLSLRRDHIVPLLAEAHGNCGEMIEGEDKLIAVDWRLPGGVLQLRANLSDSTRNLPAIKGEIVWGEVGVDFGDYGIDAGPYSVVVAIGPGSGSAAA